MDEKRKRRNRRKKWKDWMGSWLMILPALCFLLVFTIYPMLNIVRLSFFKGNALKPLKQFVGLDNYRQLFFVKTDFLTALKNTGYYTMMVVVILLTLALLFALWMRADRKINEVSQVLIFTPHLIASISCAFIWTWLYNKTPTACSIRYSAGFTSRPRTGSAAPRGKTQAGCGTGLAVESHHGGQPDSGRADSDHLLFWKQTDHQSLYLQRD